MSLFIWFLCGKIAPGRMFSEGSLGVSLEKLWVALHNELEFKTPSGHPEDCSGTSAVLRPTSKESMDASWDSTP